MGLVDGTLINVQTVAVRYLVVNTSDPRLGHQVLIAPRWIEDINRLEATVGARPHSSDRQGVAGIGGADDAGSSAGSSHV